jgi:hypothetical protein
MGAYLGFDIAGFFEVNANEAVKELSLPENIFSKFFKPRPVEPELAKAEVFFKRVIKNKAPLHNRETHKNATEEAKLMTRLRVCFKGRIYEINKFRPKMVLLPDQKQAEILADIKDLYMKYEYKNPKHYFIYDLKPFMLSGYPPSAWSENKITEEKLEPSVGFLRTIFNPQLDATTRKIFEMSEKHQLVVTFST